MDKFGINKIYAAFALWLLLVCMAFEKPTDGEKKVINKLSHLV